MNRKRHYSNEYRKQLRGCIVGRKGRVKIIERHIFSSRGPRQYTQRLKWTNSKQTNKIIKIETGMSSEIKDTSF